MACIIFVIPFVMLQDRSGRYGVRCVQVIGETELLIVQQLQQRLKAANAKASTSTDQTLQKMSVQYNKHCHGGKLSMGERV